MLTVLSRLPSADLAVRAMSSVGLADISTLVLLMNLVDRIGSTAEAKNPELDFIVDAVIRLAEKDEGCARELLQTCCQCLMDYATKEKKGDGLQPTFNVTKTLVALLARTTSGGRRRDIACLHGRSPTLTFACCFLRLELRV